ncbi:TGF_BETA_2 domain-containing protein [Trichonephila inaurata madagascariensis]|uniref:TGF_BETA_2 domain-containing protein n=1 Tax=Trichonephila inaurata madagascariensis TaxID=2747483 RepID=A0A8X6XYL9_9ARAC|nr:TGF_BETA_2 domain-containing protein [Trichonephila inaurata madagascariensis]
MTTPLPFFLLASVLILLSSQANSRSQDESKDEGARLIVPDPDVSRKMKQYKTEFIKSKILSEVNMVEPPVITTPVHVPQHLLNLLLQKEVEEFSMEDGEKLIVYPLNDNTTCNNDTHCARYQFQFSPGNKQISSMYIWIQKKIKSLPMDVVICFSNSLQDDQICENREKLYDVKYESEWSIFEFPFRLFTDTGSDTLFCTVEIFGLSIQEYEDKPFIVANLNPAEAERKRRSITTNANKNCTCCLVDFYVSFKELDWPWVVAPLGFNANMCYGKCNYQLNSYPSHYHRMLSTILNNKTTSVENKEELWTPCCSPTKLKPLDMIYVASNSTNTNSSSSFIFHKIPDMITESCGCW